jgi:cytochrome c oxidase subunit 2
MSMFQTHSDQSSAIETLFWWMLLAATIVFAGSVALITISFVLRRRKGVPVVGESEGFTRGVVLLFGIGIPITVLIGVFTVANFAVAKKTDAPPARDMDMTILVTGRQWWWQVTYPGTRNAVTANEIHIPVRTRVNVKVRTADVIHSFWVPQLNRKIDMIPGKRNRVELYADQPGRYQGQCAEYCGLQHAHMRVVVIAEPRDRFNAWLRSTAAPARQPSGAAAQHGKRVFEANACASCHQIRGTSAKGVIGPDLTHLQQRSSLAALTIPNTRSALSEWVRDPQHIKPGVRMPGLNLSRKDYDDIVAYLEELR